MKARISYINSSENILCMVKLQKTSKGQKTLTLPSQLANSMDWEKGEDLKWKFHNKNCLVVKKKNEIPEEDDIRCEFCGCPDFDQPIPVSNSDNKTAEEADNQ